jgi:hypothetical protein
MIRRTVETLRKRLVNWLSPPTENIQGVKTPDIDIMALLEDGQEQLRATEAVDEYIRTSVYALDVSKRYTSFAGVDIRTYIHDKPFDASLLGEYECWTVLQELVWDINNMGEAFGKAIELNLNGNLPVFISGKYLTAVGANEYGQAAVLAAFFVKGVDRTSSGFSIDDIVIEREITWRGLYEPGPVGPILLGETNADE